MDSRILLLLCFGLCGSVAEEGPAPPPPPPPPPPTTTTTTTTTPKPKEWCLLGYEKHGNGTRTLNQTEVQAQGEFPACWNGDLYILCNIAGTKIGDDCTIEKVDNITLYSIPDESTFHAKLGLANWFLAYRVCVLSFSSELKDGKVVWNKGYRATVESFDDYTKDFKGCIYQKDKHGAVCKLESGVSCEAKSVTIQSIAAMTADAVCDKNCIGSLAEAQARHLEFCILKFELDKSTSDVKFLGMTTAMEDVSEPPNLNACKLTDEGSIILCRADDTPNCDNEFRNGEITLNFFDTLEPNLTKDEISKMMQSVLSKDICLWRLTYEIDEMDQMYFDDMGSRVIEYSEKIDRACLHDRRKKMVTCRIGQKYDCGFYSIQDFSVRRLEQSKYDKEQEEKDAVRLQVARNRIGPCTVEVKHNDNCSISSVKFINYVPVSKVPYCVRGEGEKTVHCWIKLKSEIWDMGISYLSYGIDRIVPGSCWFDFSEKFFPNRTKGNKEKISDLYHIVLEFKDDDPCKITNHKIEIAKDIGCIYVGAGTSACSIPPGEQCLSNYFINGKGLDDLLHIPQLSECSKQNLSSYFEDIPSSLITEDEWRWHVRKWEFMPTTTEDPHAYLYNLKLDANSPGVGYPSAQIEFGDPPTQEEIAIRRSFYRGIKRVKKARISLSMLSILLPLPFVF